MIQNNLCNSCGAPLEGDPSASSWKCEYCQTVNYNSFILEKRIKDIDFSKSSNLFQLGMSSYEAGDYKLAATQLEKVLIEDSGNSDAWMYLALSATKTADAANFSDSYNKVTVYLVRAAKSGASQETLDIAKNTCANTLAILSLRIIERHFNDARKAIEAFGSVDQKRGNQIMRKELSQLYTNAEQVLSLNPNEIKTTVRIASYVLRGCKLSGISNPKNSAYVAAMAVIDSIKESNPSMYNSIASDIGLPKVKIAPKTDSSNESTSLEVEKKPTGKINTLAAILSLVIPGLGQAIQKRYKVAAIQFIIGSLLWIFFLGFIINIWSCIDAARWNPNK